MLLRLGLQEQGRAALLDAVDRLPAQPARPPPVIGQGRQRQGSRSARPPTTSRSSAWRSSSSRSRIGQLTFMRIYSGHAQEGRHRSTTRASGKKERISRILQMHADQREEIDERRRRRHRRRHGPEAMRHRRHALRPTSRSSARADDLPRAGDPQAIEPKTKADQDKLANALNRLAQEDPTFRVRTDEETRRDDHLRHGRAAPGDPRRPHEARVRRRGHRRQAAGRVPRDDPQDRRLDVEGKFVKQTGGRGQYGHVVLKVEPQEHGQGLRVRRRDQGRRRCRASSSRRSRRACARRCPTACSPATRWWT